METDAKNFVVGLGNPGRKYAGTRHNVGFGVVEVLRQRHGLAPPKVAFEALVTDGAIRRGGESRRVVLARPQTYMNASGRSVRRMMDFYKAAVSRLLVVYDDMALETGRLRARPGGSAGGHNGLTDVLAALGTEQVPRLRIGIGSPPGRMDGADYVLRPFGKAEREEIDAAIQRAADAVEDWLFAGMEPVMEKYNRKAEG